MKHIVKVTSFQRCNGEFIVQVLRNKYCDTTITISEEAFESFLSRHERLDLNGLFECDLESYLNYNSIDNICRDFADYIICKVVDFDLIFQNIYTSIQKIASSC